MSMKQKNSLFVFLALFVAGCCDTVPHNRLSEAHYRATQQIMLSEVLSPPPVAGSVAAEKDLAILLQVQRTRTKAQMKLAQDDVVASIFRFQSVMGDQFTPQNVPVTNAFFQTLQPDERQVIDLAKAQFARPRPYAISPLVKPIVEKPNNASYPSGHTIFAYVTATLLAQMVPEKAPDIFKRADQYAYNRVIAGVHFPTDIQAGRVAAAVMVSNWMRDPEFQNDFAKAKRELRHVIFQ